MLINRLREIAEGLDSSSVAFATPKQRAIHYRLIAGNIADAQGEAQELQRIAVERASRTSYKFVTVAGW